MASGDTLQGVRLPDAVIGRPGEGWRHWNKGKCLRGAYMKVLNFEEEIVSWYIKDPDGGIGSLNPARHTIEEHEDRTVTVSPSIDGLEKTPDEPHWHGWLERGVWREC